MNALVTGASGFLGRSIVQQLLARGDSVRALCRRDDPGLVAMGVELFRADIRQRDRTAAACKGVDVVFHAAGVAGIWGPWDYFHGVNTLGTRHVVDGCRAHRVQRLVYTSSPSVTFDGQSQEGVDESVPYAERWLCHYPHSKALAEQLVLAASGAEGLRTCALRPHLIWGPRDRQLVPRLLARAKQGRLRRVGDGHNLIDMIYVENAAAAHLQAADALADPASPVGGRAYFISQGEPVRCWQWIDQLLGLAGLPPVRRSIGFRTAWRLGGVLERGHRLFGIQREPVMTRFLAAQLGQSHYFDIRRAREDFGYSPQVSTAEGMRQLAAIPFK